MASCSTVFLLVSYRTLAPQQLSSFDEAFFVRLKTVICQEQPRGSTGQPENANYAVGTSQPPPTVQRTVSTVRTVLLAKSGKR